MLVRGETLLNGWNEASDFTKLFLVIESTANDGEGYTLHEMALILYPQDITDDGAPTLDSLSRINGLRVRIRHHPINNMLAPYAIIQAVTDDNGKVHRPWVTVNIKNKKEWDAVCHRFDKVIAGYERNMAKFGQIIGLGMVERRKRTNKYLTSVRELKPLVKRKKKNASVQEG